MKALTIRPEDDSPIVLRDGDRLEGEDFKVLTTGSLFGRFLFVEYPAALAVRGNNILIKDVSIDMTE
jgi:hypothetical protein